MFTVVFVDVQDLLLAELDRSVRAAPGDAAFPRALFDALEALRAADPTYVDFLASMYVEVRRHHELQEVFQQGAPFPILATMRELAGRTDPASPGGDTDESLWHWIAFALGLAQLSTLADAETFSSTLAALRRRSDPGSDPTGTGAAPDRVRSAVSAVPPERAGPLEPTGPLDCSGPSDVVFPDDLDGLTPEVLSAALADRAPDVVVDAVDIVSATRCGDGVASTADRVVLDLEYRPGTAAGLPRRLVLKTMLASPHAPDAMYRNEVRFYRELRAGLDIETPAGFASHFDPSTGRFGLLLEDLTARGARFPSALDDVSLDEVRSILGHLATLHARFWDSPRFDADLAWVATPTSGGMFEVFDAIGLDLIEDQVSRHPRKAELIAPLGRSLPQLWEQLWRVQRAHTVAPTTLLHGDPHLGNTYLLPGEQGGLLDWQLLMRGSWAHDVTYLMVTALDSEVRRRHQRDLLAEYLERLAAAGLEGVPSLPVAFGQYRAAALWGLVIGWLICPPENYGWPITEANISRTVAAVEDLETFAAIDAVDASSPRTES